METILQCQDRGTQVERQRGGFAALPSGLQYYFVKSTTGISTILRGNVT